MTECSRAEARGVQRHAPGQSASRRAGWSRVRQWGLALCLLLAAAPLWAHELYLARFYLQHGEQPDSYLLEVLLPTRSAVPGEQNRLAWPEHCVVEDTREHLMGGQLRYAFDFSCEGGLQQADILGTPWGQDGSVFTSRLQSSATSAEPLTRVLAGRGGGVTLPIGQAQAVDRPWNEVATEYTGLGMFHILEGWDHLAFVLCLCLLVSGRALLLLVTAFTVGHSISLALAYLGYLSVPMQPVEAIIALSVAFMAREAVTGTGPATSNGWRYPAVVTGFGLLHGLGFASELEGLGVSTSERLTGLLTFNLGVEIGQLIFVLIVLVVFAAARRLQLSGQARLVALATAGILGMYWFVERCWELLA